MLTKAELDAHDTDAVAWWRENATAGLGVLSTLAPLAQMYLAIPASSTGLERTFSSAAFLNTGRERLLPENLDAQVVIHGWILSLTRVGDIDVIARLTAVVDSHLAL
jgi:hypothetical protein